MKPASLCGLPERSTYAKTCQLLNNKVAYIRGRDICDVQEREDEHKDKLETVIASLSDAQFEVFFNILAGSQRATNWMYLSICAMVPGELEDMQKFYPQHEWKEPVPSLFAFKITQLVRLHGPEPKPDGMVHLQPDGRRCLNISFNIDDVDGARDLLVKIADKMSQQGLDPYSSPILLLQQFASLCQTVSKQLLMKWESKYKRLESWEGIDEVTLDLRRAYAPDCTYLPSDEWLQNLKPPRDATSRVFTIVAPAAPEEEVPDPWNPHFEFGEPITFPSYMN